MQKRKWVAVILTLVLAAGILAGCGAESFSTNGVSAPKEDYSYGGIYYSADFMEAESDTAVPGNNGSVGSAGVQNQKLIRTMYVEAETEDLDVLLAALDARISELGGYVESKSVYNGSYSAQRKYRTADLTIRIPVTDLDAFLEHVKGATNIISQKESADDITLTYVATASRITALETEQQRLLELLAKAEDMADLLMIEERLTDVRAELEEVTSQLRLYDNLVDYGTIELSVTQVQEYTVVEEVSIWQRMGDGIKENWESLCDFAGNLLVLTVASLPFLIPVAVVALVVLLIVKLTKRSSARKRRNQEPPKEM